MYGSKTTWGAGEYALVAQALKPASALALLALARQRASANLDVRWVEGDVEAVPVTDEHADVVLSVFGAMYAAEHAAAARELVRVLAPYGRLALAA
jgi:ubiquinone/menaquinone biosynthesis C-methylase UbiE